MSKSEADGNHTAPHPELAEFYGRAEDRLGYVRDLFDRSACDYDWISGLMSLWTDRSYRRQALARAGLAPDMEVLDVATGTGLMAGAAMKLGVPPGKITGLDLSMGMLREQRRRHAISLLQGVGEQLPFIERQFDFVMMGYALRHVVGLEMLFSEYERVLRKGGRVLILEITRPASPWGLRLLRIYMDRLVPWMARRRGREREVTARLMEYYWATVENCVPPQTVMAALKASGLVEVERHRVGPILSEYRARVGTGVVREGD